MEAWKKCKYKTGKTVYEAFVAKVYFNKSYRRFEENVVDESKGGFGKFGGLILSGRKWGVAIGVG